MDARLADLLREVGIATDAQAEELRRRIEEVKDADWQPLMDEIERDRARYRERG